MLDGISLNVVIISGLTQNYVADTDHAQMIDRLLNYSHLIHQFCHNLSVYGGSNPHHPKVSPFPYGLKEMGHGATFSFHEYKKAFFSTFGVEKDTLIYAGPLRITNKNREHIPRSSLLNPEDYFLKIAQSCYLLSPNGDRPECYQHVSYVNWSLCFTLPYFLMHYFIFGLI